MKATGIISIVLAVIAILLAVLWFTTNSDKTSLARQNDSIRTAFETALSTISDIQANIDSIDIGLSGKIVSAEETPQTDADRRSQLIVRLRNIKYVIESDKKRIATLEKQMKNSNLKIKGLENLVANLKTSLAEKELLLAEFTDKIGVLEDSLATERKQSQETIALKETQITEKQSIIEAKDKDLNTIFYALGTRKELLAKNIIVRKGGFLGIGRISVVQKAEPEIYDSIDLMEVDRIIFPATKNGYNILTNQSPSSYSVEKAEDTYILQISNKELFRKHKFLVIELN